MNLGRLYNVKNNDVFSKIAFLTLMGLFIFLTSHPIQQNAHLKIKHR